VGDDDVKRRILARRSVMIAAALATSTTACPKSEPCLSVSVIDSGTGDPTPLACLSVISSSEAERRAIEDALKNTNAEAGAGGTGEGGMIVLKPLDIVPDAGGPPPMPCLSKAMPCLTATVRAPPPPPQPCLKMAPPKVE
jgi:hypothetical protein